MISWKQIVTIHIELYYNDNIINTDICDTDVSKNILVLLL